MDKTLQIWVGHLCNIDRSRISEFLGLSLGGMKKFCRIRLCQLMGLKLLLSSLGFIFTIKDLIGSGEG